MRINLRRGEQTLAALVSEQGGKPKLEHDLSFELLRMRPHVSPASEDGQWLKIQVGKIRENVNVALCDATGQEQLGLGEDNFGFLDVADPKGVAGLRTVLSGPGSAGDQPIIPGEFVLELGPFEKVRIFGRRVLALYDRVEEWLNGTSLKPRRVEHSVREELYGRYNIPQLELESADGADVASLVPMGAEVIAAEGRVELVGTRDRQPLLYFAAGGPQINVTVGGGKQPVHVSHRVFRDVTSEGWYWLEDVRLGRARLLDGALFKDLIRAVSDRYEF